MAPEKISSSTTTLNGNKRGPEVVLFQLNQKKTQAEKLFPSEPESAYLSSYFRESYDFPYNPDPLCSANNYKIYDEMKHDDQVKAALSFKKDQIIGAGWQIKCEREDVVAAIEKNLRETLYCSFEDALRDIMSSFEYGFSLAEPVYQRGEGGMIELKDLKVRPPHTFEFHLNAKGDVEKILQNADTVPLEFARDYFLHYVYQPEFGNPYGRSDLRAAHQAWKTKKFFLRFWAMYVERFAMPTIIGEYPENFDSALVARLQTVLNSIQNSTVAVVPEGTKMDFKMPNRDSSNIYETGIVLLNTMIARAILMPDLLGVSGEQTKGGSYALGSTQFDMFMSIVKREQEALARKITLKIIRPMVRANWGNVSAEFEFKQHSKDDAMEALRIWTDATKAKVWKTQEEEVKHALELMKFPVPEKVEFPEPLDLGGKSPFGKEKEEVMGKEEETDEDAEKTLSELNKVIHFRELTKYEKTMNFTEVEKVLDRSEEKAINKLKRSAKEIYADFITQIRERNLLGRFKPELINELKIKNQKPMNMDLKSFMKDLYRESFNRAQKEIFPRMEKKFSMTEELLPNEFLDVIEAESFKIVGDYSTLITKKMKDKLMIGIKNGVNERDLLSQLKDLGDEESERWIKTVIRTKATEMFNRGRKSYWDNDEFAKQIIEAYQFSAILDDRTSDVCRSLDGKVFEKGEFTNNINPPLHFNCRSILVPVTKFEEYESSKEPSLDSLKDKGGNLIV